MIRPFSKLIPTPNEWLNETVEKSGISHNGLARIIELDPSLVQRWISYREKIPSHHLAEIARLIASPGDFSYALSLKYCEDFIDQLNKQIKKLSRHSSNIICDQLESDIWQSIEKLLTQEPNIKRLEKMEMAAKYLTDANFALRTWLQAAEEDYLSSLFSPSNIVRHLRYPVNHFAGLLLDSPTLRESGLINLRKIVENRKVRHESESELLARHHAIHMLARHGTIVDRDFVRDMLLHRDMYNVPMMKTLGFLGLILVEGDINIIEHFLHELQADEHLADANSHFDAIHYGDAVIDSRGSVSYTTNFKGAILHILRHLEQPAQYQNILAIELHKLIHILEIKGAEPFLNPLIFSRLSNISLNLNETKIPLDGADSVRKQFANHFRRVFEIGLQQGLFLEKCVSDKHR